MSHQPHTYPCARIVITSEMRINARDTHERRHDDDDDNLFTSHCCRYCCCCCEGIHTHLSACSARSREAKKKYLIDTFKLSLARKRANERGRQSREMRANCKQDCAAPNLISIVILICTCLLTARELATSPSWRMELNFISLAYITST
jgi:hypothetical protein